MSPPNLTCTTCNETYDAHTGKDQHVPRCQVVTLFKYPNGSIPLRRNAQGQFVCQCAHPHCPSPFKSTKHLQAHINTVREPWINRNVSRTGGQIYLLNHQCLEQSRSSRMHHNPMSQGHHNNMLGSHNHDSMLSVQTPTPPVVDSVLRDHANEVSVYC